MMIPWAFRLPWAFQLGAFLLGFAIFTWLAVRRAKQVKETIAKGEVIDGSIVKIDSRTFSTVPFGLGDGMLYLTLVYEYRAGEFDVCETLRIRGSLAESLLGSATEDGAKRQ